MYCERAPMSRAGAAYFSEMLMLDLDPRKTALVLIDLQKWTLGMPLAPHPAAEIIENAARLATSLRQAGGIIALVRVGFSAGFADMPKVAVDVTISLPENGLPADALEFPPEIARLEPDVLVLKRQWSAFYGTELDLQLRRRNISNILLGGVMTNYGVESTARDAWQSNYAVVLAEDACSSVNAEMHQFSIEKLMPRVARVRSSGEIIAELKASQ
jgi:nicotinamidase-related amidase